MKSGPTTWAVNYPSWCASAAGMGAFGKGGDLNEMFKS